MMNYRHYEVHAHQRMARLMHEAHVDRLLPAQPGVTDQLLATVGSWMIATGERLTRLSASDTHDKKLSVIETANG